jgi:transcription initiation factor TFIIH subunit 3
MNCIFAAQRRSIPIDVLKIAGEDTVFLQQATNLTGGIYFRLSGPIREGEASEEDQDQPPAPEQLLQLLLSTYLPPPNLRRMLNLPTLDEVDFRASCFCHGAIVDVGYVCGVCLSIFCHPPTKCHICSSPFPKKTLRRFEADLTAPRGNPPVVEDQQPNGDRTNGVGLVEGVPSVAMQVDD